MPEKNKKREREYSSFNGWHWLLLFLVLGSSIFLVQQNLADYQVSIISTRTAPAYDGTVPPIQKAPIWTSLTSAEWNLAYDQIPTNKLQSLPVYDPAQLKIPTEQLSWSSASDLQIRNAKITFSVPYMGNYKLDGYEYAGSHLAVDIKVPSNTPVYAIGNGVIVKVSDQTTGFGKHIVIRHDNFPSLTSSSSKETYFSSYSHLGQLLVAEGDVALKGQLIGLSGESGTATTPHVHFQIDNTNAPWHPYWPFTYQEATAAGLDFVSAINSGLGTDKALETTINPMIYVQKYLSGIVSESTIDSPATPVSEPEVTAPVEEPVSPPAEEPIVEPVAAQIKASQFEVAHPETFTKGVSETITVTAVDESGQVVTQYLPPQDVYVQVLIGGADVPAKVEARGFQEGTAKFTITPLADAALQIRVTDNEISGDSGFMTSVMFHDVSRDAGFYDAIFFLRKHEVIGGYPDGTFRPESVVNRAESLKFILKGINSDLLAASDLPFSDTPVNEWYFQYVATAHDRSIVEGYPDGSFRPANTVNRAEFLKMLLSAMSVDLETAITRDVYIDVPKDAWFAPYVKFAKDKNLIVHQGGLFKPEEGMTRAEIAELIYRLIVLKVSGQERFSSGIVVSEGDVAAFFS